MYRARLFPAWRGYGARAGAAAAAAAWALSPAGPPAAVADGGSSAGRWTWEPTPKPPSPSQSKGSLPPIAQGASDVLAHWYCRDYDGALTVPSDADPRDACVPPASSPETDLIKAQWVGDHSGWQDLITKGAWWRELYERARAGELDSWQATPWESLALVLLLDQVPRVLHSGTPQLFQSDDKALAVTLSAIERGLDLELPPSWRVFFYFPLMCACPFPPSAPQLRLSLALVPGSANHGTAAGTPRTSPTRSSGCAPSRRSPPQRRVSPC